MRWIWLMVISLMACAPIETNRPVEAKDKYECKQQAMLASGYASGNGNPFILRDSMTDCLRARGY
jgi:hypothetical protein